MTKKLETNLCEDINLTVQKSLKNIEQRMINESYLVLPFAVDVTRSLGVLIIPKKNQ